MATAMTFLVGHGTPAEPPDWQHALNYADSEVHAIAIGRQGYPLIEILVNEQPVENLRHLMRLLRNGEDEFITFEFDAQISIGTSSEFQISFS